MNASRYATQPAQFWQLGSFMLLHANPLHLVANLLILFFAGREVEPIVARAAAPFEDPSYHRSWLEAQHDHVAPPVTVTD